MAVNNAKLPKTSPRPEFRVKNAAMEVTNRHEQALDAEAETLLLHDERRRLRNAADALYRHDDVVRQLCARRRLSDVDGTAFFPSAAALAELLASVISYARAAGHSGVAVADMLDGVAAELRRTTLRRAPAPLGGDVRADAVRKAVRAYYEALRRPPMLEVS